jgi:hypothetical protein
MNQILKKIQPLLVPIKTVTIACPQIVGSDIFVTITHNAGSDFRVPGREEPLDGISTSGWSRMPDWCKRIAIDWEMPQDLEAIISELGWYLGAGYMYRWQCKPRVPSRSEHLYGGRYSITVGNNTESSATGDYAEDLMDQTEQHGCWHWEINSSYLMQSGMNKMFWPKWKAEDNTRNDEGLRESPFPGWEGTHPWLAHNDAGDGYESRFFYCKPKNYNKLRDVLAKL